MMSEDLKITELRYTKDWTNPSDFPTYEPNETQVRADMQFLFNEIKHWLNTILVPAVKQAAQTGGGSGGSLSGTYVANIYMTKRGHLIAVMQDGVEVDLGQFLGSTSDAIPNATVITQNLYAENGDISNLTVDRLSTSRRVIRYLAGDTSDDNYIKAEDQCIQFITGSTDGSVMQHTDRTGALLYWENDISTATLNALGYPEIEGVQIGITKEVTEWPVMVYVYTEVVKRSISFEKQDGEDYVPVDIFGAGDPEGKRKGKLVKASDGLYLTYETSAGAILGIKMTESGYTDVIGLRKTTGLDFSTWDSGVFYERTDGGEKHTYKVMFDSQGRPTKIIDNSGHEMNIAW